MNSKQLIGLIAISLAIVMIMGCGKTTPTTEGATTPTTEGATDETQTGISGLDALTDTKLDRYVKLESEFACQLLGVEDGNEVFEIISAFPELAEKYDFTEENIEELKLENEDSEKFQKLVMDEMNTQCPEKVKAAGIPQLS